MTKQIPSESFSIIQNIKKLQSMSSDDHRKLIQSIKQSQERAQKVLQNVQNTLSSVRTTISDIQQTNDKFQKMKADYNEVLNKLALKISSSFCHPLKSSQNDDRQKPTCIDMKKAVQAMMSCNEILFVTGAGVSADSGIPTFRGENGLYSKKFNVDGIQLDPELFINKQFFGKKPLPIWQWIQSLIKSINNGKPNQTHILIDQCLKQLSKKGKKAVLVTQNIDDFHLKPQNNQYEYHAIHGVANKMRCKNMHYLPYDFTKIEQKCKECGETLRPHVMFFDQSYGQAFGAGVKDRSFPFVVVIGSSLTTGLCIKLVSQAEQVIQINPYPVIQVGNVHPFNQQTNKVLKNMIKCIKQFN